MASTGETLSLYKKFIRAGIIRTILSRLTSLVYTFIIVRIIAPELYDYVVFFASFQFIIIIIATLGSKYATIHYAKRDDVSVEHVLALPIQVTTFIGIPIAIVIWNAYLLISFHFGFAGRLIILQNDYLTNILYIISFSVASFLESLKNRLYAELKADHVEKITTITSVIQSGMIPLMYYLIKEIYAFFIAWILTMLIPIYIWRHTIIESLKTKFDKTIFKRVFKFGFPIYALTILNSTGIYFARLIIFFKLPEGDTTNYYWTLRFNELTYTSLTVITSGLFPLLLKHSKDRPIEQIYQDNKSFFRIASTVNIIGFSSLVLAARFLLSMVLTDIYISNLTIFYVIAIGSTMQTQDAYLYKYFQAFARRSWIVIITIVKSILSILVPFYLTQFGLTGVAFSLIIIYTFRFMIELPIIRKIKFKSYFNIFYPLFIILIILFQSILISILIENPIIDLFLIFIFLPYMYIILRITKILRRKELNLILQFIPSRFRSFIGKILI